MRFVNTCYKSKMNMMHVINHGLMKSVIFLLKKIPNLLTLKE